ncbi:hypothetical protein QZH41_002686, partial [Actinostola sp. cb2023]
MRCCPTGITKLNNFEFSATDAITCWRAYGVGQGQNHPNRQAATIRDQSLNGVPRERRLGTPNNKKGLPLQRKAKSYLLAKFRIGQTTGRKLDGEVVAREMRRSRGPDGVKIIHGFRIPSRQLRSHPTFRASMPQHASVTPDEMDIQAANEEANFACARSM